MLYNQSLFHISKKENQYLFIYILIEKLQLANDDMQLQQIMQKFNQMRNYTKNLNLRKSRNNIVAMAKVHYSVIN